MYYIDTNIIIRFFTQDNEEYYQKSLEIFREIEKNNFQVHILSGVLAECVYVLGSIYQHPKEKICSQLRMFLSMRGIITDKTGEYLESLSLYEQHNIDFVDCLVMASAKYNNAKVLTFDKKMNTLLEK